jgi:hypothetical protein
MATDQPNNQATNKHLPVTQIGIILIISITYWESRIPVHYYVDYNVFKIKIKLI